MADAIVGEAAIDAACSRQRRCQMAARTSEANRLASASTALLHRVNAIKEDVRWERGAVLDAAMVEMPLTGMQMALDMMMDKKCCNKLLDYDHHHIIMEMRDQIRLALLTHSSNKQQSTAAAAADGGGGAFISKPQISSLCLPTRKTTTLQLAPWLFLFSLYQLRDGLSVANNANASVNMKVAPAAQESEEEEGRRQQAAAATADNPCWFPFRFRRRQLLAAAKCGFSLGLAVLLGLLFSNDHGFWSGLIVATTFTTARESTWAVAAVGRQHHGAPLRRGRHGLHGRPPRGDLHRHRLHPSG